MALYSEAIRQKKRITVLYAGLILIGLVLFVRLFQLQVLHHSQYLSAANKSQQRKFTIQANRGVIYWYDGQDKSPLALNQTLSVLFADPSFIKDKTETAKQLASITGDKVEDLVKKFEQPTEYVALKDKVGADMSERIKKLDLSGIGLTSRQYRVYPEGNLAAQLLGFVNADGQGQYGVEGFLDKELAGINGQLRTKTDTRGIPIATEDNVEKKPSNGRDLVLTLDRNIQAQVEKYLKQGVESVQASSGSVIVMDPQTGAIKAMANFPTYDPNDYGSIKDYGLFSNGVTGNSFEPGSGFKVITMSAGLDSGKVKPDTTYNDTGSVEIGGFTISNAENHKFGVQTMTDVIQKSLNTGAIHVLKTLGGDTEKITLAGKKVLYDYIKKFGFGTRTGIEQPGEAAGVVNPPSGYDSNYANMAFGQGLSVTMVQMAAAVSAITNGGRLYQPYLIDSITKSDGTVDKKQPKVISQVVSAETSASIIPMMEQVVLKGSGYLTQIKGYRVGGKTGTAQIPRSDGKGYEEGKNIGSFVGFAPAENPRFVMMVRINEPKVSGFAESTTVPVFANIAKWLINYYGVAPSS